MQPEQHQFADYYRAQAAAMTEKDFQATIVAHAERLGWLVYHTYDSRRSQPGYPDLHLVHPVQRRSMLRELKTEKGRLTPAQQRWQSALAKAGQDVAVWRPHDWFDRTIIGELTVTPVAEQVPAVTADDIPGVTVAPVVNRDIDEYYDLPESIDEWARKLGIELLPWQRQWATAVLTGERILMSRGRRAGVATAKKLVADLTEAFSNPKGTQP